MTAPVVQLRGVTRVYPPDVEALAPIDMEVAAGEAVAIVGPSGSGKSTLLAVLGLLDRPSRGSYLLAGQDVGRLDDRRRTRLRSRSLGFIFQSFHLLPYLTAIENVKLGARIGGVVKNPDEEAARMLAAVGLRERSSFRTGLLSGGEQQRVAIARAVVRRPELLICDEPTGNLDSATGQRVLELLLDQRARAGAVIIATHDLAVARQCSRIVTIRDGGLSS